jgi:transposase
MPRPAPGVATVSLGWPKDILRDRDCGSTWNGRIHNFWSFDKALRILENALRAAGIVPVRVGERGASSSCPACSSKTSSGSRAGRSGAATAASASTPTSATKACGLGAGPATATS